jgi:hypothetical protein
MERMEENLGLKCEFLSLSLKDITPVSFSVHPLKTLKKQRRSYTAASHREQVLTTTLFILQHCTIFADIYHFRKNPDGNSCYIGNV